jgi:ATP-dependent Clp protease adaptor protein ClpS
MTDLQKQTQDNTVRLRGPVKYHVIMLNDNSTPMEFVVQILTAIFNKSHEDAMSTTLEIHEKGRGIAGTYSFEVAEQKCVETISEARRAGFPLDVVLEETE